MRDMTEKNRTQKNVMQNGTTHKKRSHAKKISHAKIRCRAHYHARAVACSICRAMNDARAGDSAGVLFEQRPLRVRGKKLAAAVVLQLSALGYPLQCVAQPRVEEVIVTAQKQEENIQTIPLAITALTGDDLRKQGITSIAGVAQATPSMSFSPFPSSSNTLILYMRGMGNSNPVLLTSESAVGMYEDGFIVARPNAATFDLADIERVEVLRGPQGTLYGRNTTGGAINLISRQPKGEFAFRQTLGAGTRDQFRSLTVVDLPAWHDVSTKLTYLRSAIDGYVKNLGDSHDYGEESQQAGRFAAHWEPGAEFTADYFFEAGQLDSTPIYYQNAALEGATLVDGHPYTDVRGPRRRTYRPIDLALSTARFSGHGLTLGWEPSADLTLRSLTGYRSLKTDDMQDYAEAFGYPYRSFSQLDTHHFSQELTAVGSLLDDRLNYTAGLYYFEEKGSSDGVAEIPSYHYTSATHLNGTATSYAAYGQTTWTPAMLEGRLDLTLGARYTKDKREARRFQTVYGLPTTDSGTGGDIEFHRFNPSFTASYRWSDDLSTYAKVATGYRAGGFYEAAPVDEFGRTFDPEELTSFELGLKSYWLDHRLRLNVAAFEARYKDMQLTLQVDPINVGTTQIYNAGRSTIRGIETELLATLVEDLVLSLNYSYLDTTFDRVDVVAGTIFDNATNPASPYRPGDNIKNLFVLPHAPRHSIDIGVDYVVWRFAKGSVDTHLDYRWQDRAYQTPAAGSDVPGRDFNSQDPYGLLNGRISLTLDLPRGDSATLALWGKNIAHKDYQQHVITTGTPVATAIQPAGYASNAEAWSEPASWGIEVQYRY
jgi:iron complex outermembrane receptor protein